MTSGLFNVEKWEHEPAGKFEAVEFAQHTLWYEPAKVIEVVGVRSGGETAVPTMGHLLRYEATGEIYQEDFNKVAIYLYRFVITRRTTACDVIVGVDGFDKFVQRNAKKRYAYPTQKEAWHSFLKRCRWRVAHTERPYMIAKMILNHVEGKGYEQFVHRPEIG